MAIAVLFILLFLLLLIGTPIAFSLGLASLTTIIFFSNDSLTPALNTYCVTPQRDQEKAWGWWFRHCYPGSTVH